MDNKNINGARIFLSVILYIFLLISFYVFTFLQTLISLATFKSFDYKKFFRKTMFFTLRDIYLAFLGIKIEIRGLENVPKGECIFLSKHSSSIETMLFVCLPGVKDVCPVARSGLFLIPFFNLFLFYVGAISVNKSHKGAETFFMMLKKVKDKMKKGSKVLIFPEGTRTPADADTKFHLGIMKLYPEVTFVPVALNSGEVFGKDLHSPKKRGKLIIEFLPPIPSGLEMSEARRLVTEGSVSGSRRLAKEAFE